MTIGVYGAAGWIGSAVCRRAGREGPLRRFARSAQTGTIGVPDRPEPKRLAEQLAGLQAVIVTAGAAHVPKSATPAEVFANAVLPATVVRAAELAGVSRVVLLSSIKAVAEHSKDGPIVDTTTPAPTTPYGRSKRLGELAAIAAADNGVELCVVRTPLVIGAEAPANFGRILRFVRRGLPVPLPYPFPYRSVTVRSNLADLLVHLARSEKIPHTYVTASEILPLTTSELVRGVSAILGSWSIVIPVPKPLSVAALRMLGRGGDFAALTTDLIVEPSGKDRTAEWTRPNGLFPALDAELAES